MCTMPKILKNNPLFKDPEEPAAPDPVLTEADVATIRAAQSDVEDFTTMTFKVRKTHLKKLRDYAFTNRVEIKEALDEILGDFLDKIDDTELLEYPVKQKKQRRS